MKKAAIKGIEYYLPEDILDNTQLAREFSDWSAEKIAEKTGIHTRHVAKTDECASDLAEKVARKLFNSGVCAPEDIDFILLCTQSPDYFLPTTACLLQERLGIPTTAGALDFNLGCSGYVYGLSLAKGLIETNQVKNVLLITAETYSKYIHPDDANVKTIFGDAAAATFIQEEDAESDLIGPFVFGTDGSGKDNLIVKEGALRFPKSGKNSAKRLYMNGPEIFLFTIKSVPQLVNQLLEKTQASFADIDYFVFHQANKYMLTHLRDKIGIPEEKFYINMQDCGNTVSSSIPIALSNMIKRGLVKSGSKVMLVGFGVGYSWAGCSIKI